ncbi:dirigent protein 2 [Phoenix dactylifera]|uniref:Dirigent protein n=1 Tax=Phoenix dactylifera TaxID=42345 RepID=A0A8B7BW40_PHODC|nr:dirigent protein 2 [Phoenix dactylifera]
MAAKPNLSLLFLLALMPMVVVMAQQNRRQQNLTHIHFYVHDTLSGPNPTTVRVVEGPMKLLETNLNFGDIFVFDDPLTEGPNPTSKLLGRAYGSYIFASQSTTKPMLLLTVNIVLMDGQYDGSTFSIVASDASFVQVVEMPIVGGTGRFRMARGYAHSKTYWYNTTTYDGIYEVDAYLLHFVI